MTLLFIGASFSTIGLSGHAPLEFCLLVEFKLFAEVIDQFLGP
jgi:hypothetical protein